MPALDTARRQTQRLVSMPSFDTPQHPSPTQRLPTVATGK
jgi:hypothetical protein